MTMREVPSDVYSLIILYLIMVHPLANTLLDLKILTIFLSIILLVQIFLLNFMVITILLLMVDLDYSIMIVVFYKHWTTQLKVDVSMIHIYQHQISWKRRRKVFHKIVETTIRKKTFTTENVIDLSFEKTTIVNMHHDTIDDSVICLQKEKNIKVFNVSNGLSMKRKVHLNKTNNVLDSQESTKKRSCYIDIIVVIRW